MADDFFIYCSNADGFLPADASKILPISWPVFSSPIPVINTPLVFRQEYFCHASKFVPTDYNTAHPDFKDFILVNESERQDAGANCVKWARTYAKIPPSYSLPGSTTYSFIGFQSVSGVNTQVSSGRGRYTDTVATKVVFDFFLIDKNNYKTSLDIPVIQAQLYYINVAAIEFALFADELTSATYADQPSVPSVETYLGWVKNKTPIVAVGSTLRTWMGNIVERQTVYILPQ